MNAFSNVSIHAREGRLPSSVLAYYASEAFRERSEFKGDTAQRDRLNVQHHLLGCLALSPDPLEIASMRQWLAHGTVVLRFFGVANPIPMFSVDVGSREQAELMAAIDANLASRMFKVAHKVIAWRSSRKVSLQYKNEAAVLKRMSDRMVWPHAGEFKADYAKAQIATNLLNSQLSRKADDLRARRRARMAMLAHAATPGLTNWTDFVENIALQVLTPPAH